MNTEGIEEPPKQSAASYKGDIIDNTILKVHKDRLLDHILYRKVLATIERRADRHGKDGFISYPEIFFALSHFHLDRAESVGLFDELKAEGLIEVIPLHGIRLNKNALRDAWFR